MFVSMKTSPVATLPYSDLESMNTYYRQLHLLIELGYMENRTPLEIQKHIMGNNVQKLFTATF